MVSGAVPIWGTTHPARGRRLIPCSGPAEAGVAPDFRQAFLWCSPGPSERPGRFLRLPRHSAPINRRMLLKGGAPEVPRSLSGQ